MHYRSTLQRRYDDRASVSRHVRVKRGAETVLELQEMVAALPCRLSQTSLAKNGQTEAENRIQYDAKLFCSPDQELLQGDVISVTRGSIVRRYTAGEPFVYRTHQEVGLTRKERA